MLKLIETETICQMSTMTGCIIQTAETWLLLRSPMISKQLLDFLAFVGMNREIELFSERSNIFVNAKVILFFHKTTFLIFNSITLYHVV